MSRFYRFTSETGENRYIRDGSVVAMDPQKDGGTLLHLVGDERGRSTVWVRENHREVWEKLSGKCGNKAGSDVHHTSTGSVPEAITGGGSETVKEKPPEYRENAYWGAVMGLLNALDTHISWWQGVDPNSGEFLSVSKEQTEEIQGAYNRIRSMWPKCCQKKNVYTASVIAVDRNEPGRLTRVLFDLSGYEGCFLSLPFSFIGIPELKRGDVFHLQVTQDADNGSTQIAVVGA